MSALRLLILGICKGKICLDVHQRDYINRAIKISTSHGSSFVTSKPFKSDITGSFSQDFLLGLLDSTNYKQFIPSYILKILRLDYIGVWKDVSVDGPPSHTQILHRDNDGLFQYKIFIYLSDVGIRNGPFVYQAFSHHGIVKGVSQCFTGEIGSFAIADMNGLHRGSPLYPGESRITAVYRLTSSST